MYEFLMIAYLIVAIVLVGIIMIQQGKGADMGASFGAGSSNTVFGSGGSGNFLTRTTAVIAIVFFVLSLILGNLSSGSGDVESEFENIEAPAPVNQEVPTSGNDVPESE
ncbi:preprotein translocase subunit SecG [Pseudidiomarina terrestris]|uniref:Protein-export membrane protein SecG n=1 Tax=Pseudidiomarina terrestris TaxID=2820060 RepID=A0AAW7QSX4_9GAMM|nr:MULTISPECIES: preprotein translocase subunit SecG [unclassified Pseudidiomarina]MDN7123320.1 preprotein translocase subunit SecG [Pseudidiomarina sp. 1APP75-32.1]MDN7127848.1 preprotein translocase subunit SecG [Pseudidiomarina sp. 1APR75-33.1]MDN7128955.1 preprotein translocase subunit SecG [Pseudidiomarina sp. 1APR75-15]MDN7134782.1 preprotein translocase subunit SecG [Pseudidiomarina sp. 1ASP75-5]MDN7137460.1 preprotein translocase subunit SecG [Pseudidiomarina sp. 1ASP75-14]